MSVNTRKTIRCLAATAAVAVSGGFPIESVFAQAVLEEIVVTARKTEENLNDAPVTVSAFVAESISNLGVRDVGDIARFAPGLSFSSAFGRTTERPVVRGQGNILAGVQFGVESGVAYFVDGIYYNGDIQSLDLNGMERVEVVKGPQSALYGRNAYSGAINFVTKRIDREFQGDIGVRMLEDGEVDATASFGGQLIEDVLGVRLSLRDYSFDGQWTNQVTQGDVGDEDSRSLDLLVDWTPSDSLSLRLRWRNQEDKDGTRPFFLQPATEHNCQPGFRSLAFWPLTASGNDNQYFCGEIKARPIALNDGPDADGVPNAIPGLNEGSTFFGTVYGTTSGVAFSGVERDLQAYNAVLDYEFGGGYRLTVRAGYRDEERKSGSDSDYSPVNFILIPGFESLFALSELDEYAEESYEVRLASPADRRVSWTLGAFYYDYERDNSDITFTGIDPVGASNMSPHASDDFIENRAWFGSLGWRVNDGFRITLEGRQASEEKSQEKPFFGRPGELQLFEDDADFDSFTARLTLDYVLDDDTLLYGIYSQGVKPGGLNGPEGVEVGSPEYDEEESENFEIGVKRAFFDGRVQGNLALYFTDIVQYQLTTPATTPSGALDLVVTNQGDGEVRGVELDLRMAATENVEIGLTYALADSEFTEGCDEFQWTLTSGGGRFTGDPATSLNPTGRGDCSIEGHQFPMGSKHQASAYVDFETPLGGSGVDFFGNLNLSYESRKYTQVHQESYVGAATLLGARIGLRTEKWTVAFIGRNLTDEDSAVLATRWLQSPYISVFSLNVAPPAADRQPVRAFYSLPRRERQLGVEFSYRF